MTPAAIDRVFGRGRLRMVTGDHVEVFREESQPGERRRYTKRFLATPAGDFRAVDRARVAHPARGSSATASARCPTWCSSTAAPRGRQALVQTYDAGVTVDHWATLLPVQRDGETRCATCSRTAPTGGRWRATAWSRSTRSTTCSWSHLDLKADNVCIPVGLVDFDPDAPPAHCLLPDFEQHRADRLRVLARLGRAPRQRLADRPPDRVRLPVAATARARSRRAAAATSAPTRLLDWRCDLFSLAAMLRRYLPEPEQDDAVRLDAPRAAAQARALVRRLLEAHDAELPAVRPHAELDRRDRRTSCAIPELADSLQRGWRLGERSLLANGRFRRRPSLGSRCRSPVPLSPLRFVDTGDAIAIDPSDVEGWAAANPPPPRGPAAAMRVGSPAWPAWRTAAAAVPLLGEAWRRWAEPGVGAARGRDAAARFASAPPQRVATARGRHERSDATRRKMRGDRQGQAADARSAAARAPSRRRRAPRRWRPPVPRLLRLRRWRRRPSVAAECGPISRRRSVRPRLRHAGMRSTADTRTGPGSDGEGRRAGRRLAHPEAAAKTADGAARRAASPAPRRVARRQADVDRRRSAPRHVSTSRRRQRRAGGGAAGSISADGSGESAARRCRSPITCRRRLGWRRRRGARLDAAGSAARPSPPRPGCATPAATPRHRRRCPRPATSPSRQAADRRAARFHAARQRAAGRRRFRGIAQRAERMVLAGSGRRRVPTRTAAATTRRALAAGAIRPRPRRSAAARAPRSARVAPVPRRRAHRPAAGRSRRGAGPADPGLRRQSNRCRDRRHPGLTCAFARTPSQPRGGAPAGAACPDAARLEVPVGADRGTGTPSPSPARSPVTIATRAMPGWCAGAGRRLRAPSAGRAIDAYALYGEALRSPVEAMLYRANAASTSPRSRLCEWPPHWSATASTR